MSESAQNLPKAKKSVALCGIAAGNTAMCTVGRSGNDLHYRGYDIHDLATKATFEEVAHLLVHGELPTTVAARRLRDQAQAPARHAGDRHRGAGAGAGRRAPDGRAAHRLLGARHVLPEREGHRPPRRATSPTG